VPSRLALAADFVTALQNASRRNPASWLPAGMIGKAAGIENPDELAQAVCDAVYAGLVYRRDDNGCVLLTDKGRAAAAD